MGLSYSYWGFGFKLWNWFSREHIRIHFILFHSFTICIEMSRLFFCKIIAQWLYNNCDDFVLLFRVYTISYCFLFYTRFFFFRMLYFCFVIVKKKMKQNVLTQDDVRCAKNWFFFFDLFFVRLFLVLFSTQMKKRNRSQMKITLLSQKKKWT